MFKKTCTRKIKRLPLQKIKNNMKQFACFEDKQ